MCRHRAQYRAGVASAASWFGLENWHTAPGSFGCIAARVGLPKGMSSGMAWFMENAARLAGSMEGMELSLDSSSG